MSIFNFDPGDKCMVGWKTTQEFNMSGFLNDLRPAFSISAVGNPHEIHKRAIHLSKKSKTKIHIPRYYGCNDISDLAILQ